eukprot:NODE_227_length_13866_cov_0.400305.p8 type:complete len:113 gc:universal NODE_227_length_13866_cov_0.400305:505-167(-)
MSEISIDENGKLRVLSPAIYKQSEDISSYAYEFMNNVQDFVDSSQSSLSNIQEQVNIIEDKRSRVIGYQLLIAAERQKRAALEIQFKETYNNSLMELDLLEKQLSSFQKGEE